MNVRLRPRSVFPRSIHLEDWLVLLLVLAGTVLATTKFNHYGVSWDEAVDYRYAREALSAYRGGTPDWTRLGETHYLTYLATHGPAYLMVSEAITGWLAEGNPSWSVVDIRHLLVNLTFQLGVLFLYILAEQLVGRRAALYGCLLFSTQPLLLGHSFINQKDVPFMAAFLAAVALGLRWVESIGSGTRTPPDTGPGAGLSLWDRWDLAREDWSRTKVIPKATLILLSALFIGLAVDLFILNSFLLPALQATVRNAYEGASFPIINRWFSLAAQEAAQTPVDAYVGKVTELYLRLRTLVALLGLVPLLASGRNVFPHVTQGWSLRRWFVGMGAPRAKTVCFLLLSGVSLGLAIAIRSLGIFAGALVTLAALVHRRWPLTNKLIYWGVALGVAYASWPYLWTDPIGSFMKSFGASLAHPWPGDILYSGRLWDAGDVPWHYLPFLTIAQLTLPLSVLAIVGFVAIRPKARSSFPLWLCLAIWFVAPILGAVLLRPTVYDNTRQFLFTLPPLFVSGGLGTERILRRLPRRWLRGGVLAAALLPGLLGVLRLHPYEYMFYNSLLGGTHGAARRYETDYWCTSYREAMEWLNANAPSGAVILATGPFLSAAEVSRPDLVIESVDAADVPSKGKALFGLACTRTNQDLSFFPDRPTVWHVEAGGAVLAVVRRLGGRP